MYTGNKRGALGDENKPKRLKKECDYGERCYRRNPAHFREFKHKHLESILDQYSGSGDYPIPEKYVLERLTIMEQLDVIVEKDFYTPWKNQSSSSATPQQNTSLNSYSLQSTQMKRNLSPSTRNRESQGPRQENHASKNDASSSKNIYNTALSNINARTSIKNDESSSQTELLTQNRETSNNNTTEGTNVIARSSSRNDESSNKKYGTSNKNYGSSNKNDAHAPSGSNNNNIKNDAYKNAPDYKPIVPPTLRVQDFLNVVLPRGKMAAKHAAQAPYYIFYTTITAAKETHTQPYSISFQEILDHSLGELKCSLQINFMVELGWLLAQYYFAGYRKKKLTILYGEESQDLKTISTKKPHIDAHKINMPTPFGTHHTKMMLLYYEDGSLRVVISTANLYLDDWENRTQGLWFSPACPEMPPSAMAHDGESPTMFKRSLLSYLNYYRLPALQTHIERVKRADFSHINVFLVASVPGSHSTADWGLTRAGSLLRQHCMAPGGPTYPLLAQASSIGSYGAAPNLWLCGDFLHHLTKVKDQPQTLTPLPPLKLIYPSLENVRGSHDGLLGGGCLPYGAAVHTKQAWLNDYLYQWHASSTGRDRAMPHVKSYTRTSPDNERCAYLLLTSANASKAAWGQINKGNGHLRVMSYECGVLFLPKYVINADFFPLDAASPNRLVLPYDIPPTKYTSDMSPWVMDYLT